MTYLQRTLRMTCNKHEMMATFSVMSASAFNYVSKLSQKYFPTQGAKKRMGWGCGEVVLGELQRYTHTHTHTQARLLKHTHAWCGVGETERGRKRERQRFKPMEALSEIIPIKFYLVPMYSGEFMSILYRVRNFSRLPLHKAFSKYS